ncbi:hypothetical protein BDP55DRAFT_405044 [Colletotrichum godetiae]|uniref:Uncharacterized protein n=1 Tax=Colletotrichum godetiae TaxID=1209918 RepID=A0AAJ0EN06_9PEZI|nr:uncharacterized protein BDP55DRAFT_405044 [Colletotrichum godetiae]KAK1658066.1 hypothetical protein BDP55DRAFT_405044 [Colletotrichum godetiae]
MRLLIPWNTPRMLKAAFARHRTATKPSNSHQLVPDRHAHPREIIGPTPEPSDGYTAASDEESARIKRIIAKTQMVEELTQEVVDIFMSAGSSGAVASPLLNHGGGTNQLM